MACREKIVSTARDYLNTPFRHQGRVKGIGIDCVGLPICVARDLGIFVYDKNNYPPQPSGYLVLQECQQWLVQKPVVEAKPGDVGVFALPTSPCHTAILTDIGGALGMIHAYNRPPNKVVEHRLSDDWRKSMVAVFSFPGVED